MVYILYINEYLLQISKPISSGYKVVLFHLFFSGIITDIVRLLASSTMFFRQIILHAKVEEVMTYTKRLEILTTMDLVISVVMTYSSYNICCHISAWMNSTLL